MGSAPSLTRSVGQEPTTQSRRKTYDVTALACSHGVPLASCPAATCREIRHLLDQPRAAPLRRHVELIEDCHYGDQDGRWWERRAGGSFRSPGPTQTTLRPDAREGLTEVFPTETTVGAAVQFGAISARQGELLDRFLTTDDRLSWTACCEDVGRQVTCSRQTVSRALDAIIQRVSVGTQSASPRADRFYVSREKGSRRREVWERKTVTCGAWRSSWEELVTDGTQARILRAHPTHRDQILKSYTSTPMNQLCGELLASLSEPPLPSLNPGVTASPDWTHNVRWARWRMRTARPTVWPTHADEILRLLTRGCRRCGYCRTPLLAGCRLGGKTVRKNRQYCGEPCRDAFWRRQSRRQHGLAIDTTSHP